MMDKSERLYTAECRHPFEPRPCTYVGQDDHTVEACCRRFVNNFGPFRGFPYIPNPEIDV